MQTHRHKFGARLFCAGVVLALCAALSAHTAPAAAQTPAAPPPATPPPTAAAGSAEPVTAPAPDAPAPVATDTANAPPTLVPPMAAGGPQIDLPSDASTTTAPGTSNTSNTTTGSNTAPSEPETKSNTLLGGYAQFTLESLKVGHANFDTTANVRRLVLFVTHEFNADIRAYTEIEWENAVTGSGLSGSAEIEQAYVDWRLLGDSLVLRTGLILVPMGIINQYHEPPVFNGVERPFVDQFIIPTTWRELGAGFTGKLGELSKYELYLTTTLDPTSFNAGGFAAGRTFGSLSPAKAVALTGRYQVEPILGLIAGASFFISDTGGNGDFFDSNHKPIDISVPVYGYALDARFKRWGFETRAVWSQFFLPRSNVLLKSLREDGSAWFPNAAATGAVPDRTQGGYFELGYDVLHELHSDQQLVAFLRLETYDQNAAMPKGFARSPLLDVQESTMGLTYRPIQQLVFKGDVQLRDRRLGYDELGWNLGMGYMF